MNNFTIKDIENMCGIKAHTLRIWEQRYQQLFIPKRKDSQHRVYDSDDLKMLLRISFLYHNGYKISKIAGFTAEQIQHEIATIQPTPCHYEVFVHQLMEAGLQLDDAVFQTVSNQIVAQLGIEKSILHIFYPFLNRIGRLWMTNHIIPAQEHFSSHIIRKKIICAIDSLPAAKKDDNNVVVFSPQGEQHEIPLLVINYLLKKQGIGTTYFGTNVASDTLHYYTSNFKVTHFYTHLITHLDGSSTNNFICNLADNFPGTPVYVSGPAGTCICDKPVNVVYLQSLADVMGFINSLALKKESLVE